MRSAFDALRIMARVLSLFHSVNQSGMVCLPMKLLLLPVCVRGVCVIYMWGVCVYALLLDSTESVDSEPAQSSPPF